MKYSNIVFFFLLLLFFICGKNGFAQQLVYTPINPSFGGYYYNGTWMLAQAQAEKKFTGGTTGYTPQSTNPLQNFQSTLNNAILSQLSQKIISQVFGENTLQKGTYQFGNYSVNINPQNDGLHIDIEDISNGNQTSVVVPYY